MVINKKANSKDSLKGYIHLQRAKYISNCQIYKASKVQSQMLPKNW